MAVAVGRALISPCGARGPVTLARPVAQDVVRKANAPAGAKVARAASASKGEAGIIRSNAAAWKRAPLIASLIPEMPARLPLGPLIADTLDPTTDLATLVPSARVAG